MTGNTVIWGIVYGLFALVIFDASGSEKWTRRDYITAAALVALVWFGIYLI